MAKKQESTSSSSLLQSITASDLGLSADHRRSASPEAFSIWVRSLLQNWRQGTVGCKGRSDVSLTNKKPFKQKGTGRARAGSARSPLWRGGGVVFGPQKRTKTLTIAKNTKKSVLNTMLFNHLDNGMISVIDWSVKGETPKTADAFALLKNAGLDTQRVTLFLTLQDKLTQASFANIPNVKLLSFDEVNAYDLASGDAFVVLKKDLDHFKEMVSKWI